MMKPIDIRPLTGYMDARTTPGEVRIDGYRLVKNVRALEKGRLCKVTGWDKFRTKPEGYNNEDLHDQLASLTAISGRLPVTFLFEARSTRNSTKLIAGTERALYVLNNSTGNWKVISDKLGGSGARWEAAQVKDVVVFTNNRDEPVYWNYGQEATEADDQSVAKIADLETELTITRAGVVIAWKGHVFLMNVTQDGQVFGNRIVWCDFENALSWVEGSASTAGNADITHGETILAAGLIRDTLLVYTNRGIWEGRVGAAANGPTFTFTKRYEPEDSGENVIFYPNTLVSIGDEHLYMGSDGIYTYNLFLDKPKRPEWIHAASELIYQDLNASNCEVHIAAYNSKRKEVLISWAGESDSYPTQTLVLHTDEPFSYLLDHGFTAMLTHTPRLNTLSIREWFLDLCICATSTEFDETFGSFTKEGQFCEDQTEVSCTPKPVIFTATTLTVDDVVVEDYTQSSADVDSLCTQLDGLTLSDLCELENRADECNSLLRFVAASATDFCIKEFSDNYYREECTVFTGCGTYVRNGYKSLIRSGPLAFKEYRNEKELHFVELELETPEAVVPGTIKLRIGTSNQALDSNVATCGIKWFEQDDKTLECPSVSASTHESDNTRPDEGFNWPTYYIGKYLYYEIEVVNPDSSPVDTGAAFCLSRISMGIELSKRRY